MRQQRDFVKHKEKGLIKLKNTISSKLYGSLPEFQDPINVEKKNVIKKLLKNEPFLKHGAEYAATRVASNKLEEAEKILNFMWIF